MFREGKKNLTLVVCFLLPLKVKVKVKSLSHVLLFVTPWTAAYQAPPSMGFSRQECWSGLPFPSSERDKKTSDTCSLFSPFGDPSLPACYPLTVKVLYSICQQIWKTQQWPQDWKRCFHSNHKERQCKRILKLPHKCIYFTR